MTTSEESEMKTRTIDELLHLGTYQGMTDEEITRVINYNAKIAAERADSDARKRELEQQLQTMQEESAKARAEAQAAFEKACALTIGGVANG